MLELALKSLFAYLLGSLMGALVAGRARGVDIREMGSGNAGGPNALRTQGFGFALAVVVVDVGKALACHKATRRCRSAIRARHRTLAQ